MVMLSFEVKWYFYPCSTLLSGCLLSEIISCDSRSCLPLWLRLVPAYMLRKDMSFEELVSYDSCWWCCKSHMGQSVLSPAGDRQLRKHCAVSAHSKVGLAMPLQAGVAYLLLGHDSPYFDSSLEQGFPADAPAKTVYCVATIAASRSRAWSSSTLPFPSP